MSDFWTNISRYPRFFISSVVGLILIILTPFKNLFKVPKFRVLVAISLITFSASIYFIILKMVGL